MRRRHLRTLVFVIWLCCLGPLGYAASAGLNQAPLRWLEETTDSTSDSTSTDTTPTTEPTTTEPTTTEPTTTEPTTTIEPTTTTEPTTTAEPTTSTEPSSTAEPTTTSEPTTTTEPPTTTDTSTGSSTSTTTTTTTTTISVPSPPAPPQVTTIAAPPATTGRKPPTDVGNVRVVAGDTTVTLTYSIAANADHVVISRTWAAGAAETVYSGNAASYTDRGLTNGVEYRYVIRAVDEVGTASGGVAVTVTPRANLLRTPKEGARLRKAPKLLWIANREASYYNLQLFRGDTKVLSVWPKKARFQLRRTWKFDGRKQTLSVGVYRWYVWPGFGPRTSANYGDLLGARSFEVVR